MNPTNSSPRAPEAHEIALEGLLSAAYMIQRELKDFFKPYDLTPQQHNVLTILKSKSPGSCAAQDIKEGMRDKTPDLTRLIERLRLKGLVKREVNESNRRKIDVGVTYQGLDLLEVIRPSYEAKLKELMPLGQDELELLGWLLNSREKGV